MGGAHGPRSPGRARVSRPMSPRRRFAAALAAIDPPRPSRRRTRALLSLDDLGRARAPRGRPRVALRARHGLELRAPRPHEGARGPDPPARETRDGDRRDARRPGADAFRVRRPRPRDRAPRARPRGRFRGPRRRGARRRRAHASRARCPRPERRPRDVLPRGRGARAGARGACRARHARGPHVARRERRALRLRDVGEILRLPVPRGLRRNCGASARGSGAKERILLRAGSEGVSRKKRPRKTLEVSSTQTEARPSLFTF